ncbi:MAG: cysteine hydrolase [Dehalococcoidia bacterium]
MAHDSLDPNKTAVLFFDMLNAYHGNDEPVVQNCARLRDAADEAGIPVFFAMANHRPDGSDAALLYSDTNYQMVPWKDPENDHIGKNRSMVAGSREIEVLDALKPSPTDYVIRKHRWNAFFQTSMELSMRTVGIDTIVLCGGSTHVGVASTAYGARDLDFNLVIASDCCDDGLEGSQEHFMTRIFPMMARVRTGDEVIEMMRQGAMQTVR